MLSVDSLTVSDRSGRHLLDQMTMRLEPGEIVGLTGESGCGKTTLIKSIMGLLRTEQLTALGSIRLDGQELLGLHEKEYCHLRGTGAALIPQNPMTAFDPSWRIGGQMAETFRLKRGMNKGKAQRYAADCLRRVNLTDTERILESFPGQLSGGMLQRIAVALVFGLSPRYILADEPTSALDEANCEVITDLLISRRETAGILFISHDAKALRRAASRMLVMAEGRIVDGGGTQELFEHPVNPHTREFVNGVMPEEGGWQWERFA